MDTGATLRVSRVLLTGPPGIGKTTLCKKLASIMEEQNYKFNGFYTEEVRGESNSRIGFDVVLMKNREKRSTLARIENVISQSEYSKYKVGNYHVFLNEFETTALPIFDSDADILIIDEVGKMELFSQKFHDKIIELFFGTSSKRFIIATIPQIHKNEQCLEHKRVGWSTNDSIHGMLKKLMYSEEDIMTSEKKLNLLN